MKRLSTIILASMLFTAPTWGGELREAKIINGGASGAAIHLKRNAKSFVFQRLKNGELLTFDDCRDARGRTIIDRYAPAFGKKGGTPKAIHKLWCGVQYQAKGSDEIVHGWVLGKYISALPLP